MTPEEYYKKEFNPSNWDIVSHLKDASLFSFNSMIQFAELYHNEELLNKQKMRYAIKHIPSNKFLYENEGVSFLVDESEGFITFGDKTKADKIFSYYDYPICTEDGEFSVDEFEVVELK